MPGVGAVQAYLMAGDVLAAHAGDEEVRLLARVSAANLLPAADLEALAESCSDAGEFTDALYGVLDEDAVQALLHERFRENLFCFLGATQVAPFEPTDALFVANIQVGHDSNALLEELACLRDRVAPLLSSRLLLLPGEGGTAATTMEAHVIETCSNGIGVSELLRRAAAEPNRVLQLVADLLERGALTWDPAAPVAPVPPRAPEVEAALALDLPLDDDYTDDGTPRPAAPAPATAAMDEEYLDAFGDYDTTRGDGSFSGVRDRIDLEAADPDDDAPGPKPGSDGASELIDMPEADAAAHASAVSLNFSGPRLADDDARNKLEVVNEVLEAVRAAIDYLEGAGSGQSRVQLIVDGSSGPFSALFNGVELREDGRLPVDVVLKNLRKRPITEHRRLLQRASTDIIERALSLASEDLDDVLMEQVLEKVAGYQQRLGI